ncbi:hypothetical protein [Nonomuraea rubra]
MKIRARMVVVALAMIGAGIVLAGPSHADGASSGGSPVSTNGFTWSN